MGKYTDSMTNELGQFWEWKEIRTMETTECMELLWYSCIAVLDVHSYTRLVKSVVK